MRLAASALVTTVLLVGSEGALRAEDDAALFLPISEAVAFSQMREHEPAPPPQDRQRDPSSRGVSPGSTGIVK